MKRTALIECRTAANKTQAQVAADLNISEIYVRKIESSDRNPGSVTIFKFAQYYGKPAQELFPDIFLAAMIQNVSDEHSATSAKVG
jgi:putative transcriptional regulator